jgi:hypothetical protein
MKTFNKTILLVLIFTMFSGLTFAQKQVYPSKPQEGQKEMIDTRVDNMGYWKKMAAQGLVPVAPEVTIPEAIYTGSMINAKSVKGGKDDSPDVPVTSATNVTESENSVFVNPNDNDFLLNSNNSTAWPNAGNLYGANAFLSADGGNTWGGTAQGAGGGNSGDPTTAINLDGSRMYVNYITNPGGMGIAISTNNGATWSPVTVAPNPGSLADKNHMWIDNSPVSSYLGNLYIAWTDFGGSNNNNIVLKASTNGGANWGTGINLSSAVNAGSHNQGVNIQTGPNGQVYVIWSIYDSWPQDEKAIGFTKSTNGGTSFAPATRIINNTKGIRNSGVGKSMRVNSFPSMAIDISGGSYNGNLYVVWTNIGVPGVNTGTSADVYMIKSTNEGATWSTPIRINQDPTGLGKKHYFPWITCDPETGILSVIFYDDRNTTSAQCETWCANSSDGGETWEDFKVSDVAFTPTPIPGLASSYMGDYLGITARGSKVYPAWTDTRNSLYMTYVSPYVTNNLPKPTNLTLQLDEATGEVSMGWLFEGGSKPFLYFNVYRGGVLLGTTTDLTYSDILPDYGVYQYAVTAMHDDGESVPASASIQWGNPHIYVSPEAINTNLLIGTSTIETIVVKNVGQLELNYTVSPLINNKKSGKDYCSASGNCDEYISNVTFGTINKSSACDGYANYTNLSTILSPGQSYPISVTNGNTNYPADQCGIWVDWNQDQDFNDAGESITVSGTPGIGPYTANIIPPASAVPGETRLRVRITYTGSVDPCGSTTYGEVEDYSVFVLGWLLIDNYGGNLMPGDSALVNVTLDASDLDAGIYTANINIGSNDPDMGMVTVPITLAVGASIPMVDAYANPALICEGETTQLFVDITGGSGTFTYSWTSIPEGFISNDPSPMVSPADTTLYIVSVFDGIFTVTDEALVEVEALPGISGTPTGETVFCIDPPTTTYSTEGAEYAMSYFWSLTPETAGTISGAGQQGIVDWNVNFTGDAYISVKGINDCGDGEVSEILMVTIHGLPEVSFNMAVDSVCVYTPEFELNTAQPSGGMYAGDGVYMDNNNTYWFDPSVVTTGEHTIHYLYTDANGCQNIAGDIIYVGECLGINKVFDGLQLEIFPNPSNGTFTVKLKSESNESMNLRIINNMGKVVYMEENIMTQPVFIREIDLSGYSEGLYFINLNSNNSSYIEKIIIKK